VLDGDEDWKVCLFIIIRNTNGYLTPTLRFRLTCSDGRATMMIY